MPDELKATGKSGKANLKNIMIDQKSFATFEKAIILPDRRFEMKVIPPFSRRTLKTPEVKESMALF